jgi:hypothetical protein
MSTENLRPAPPARTPQQIADMAPQERQQYLTDRANAGVKDDGLFGAVQRIMAQTNAQAQAANVGDQNVKQLQTQDVTYVQGLHPSDADYLGHDHEQLKSFLDTNLDPKQVTDVSNAYHSLHEAFDGFGKAMTDGVNQSKGAWEGDAAASAQGYFTSLGTWADANSTNAKLASETIYDQQTAASNAKNAMPEVVKFDMTDEMAKWGQAKDPFAFADAISNTYKTYDQSQKAHEEAAGVMTQYDKNLYTAASKQPAFAEPPKFGLGTGTGGTTLPSSSDQANSATHSGDTSSGYTGGNSNLPSGSYGGHGSSSSGGSTYTGSQLPSGGHSTGSGSVPPGYTAPSGYQPTNLPPGTNPNPNSAPNSGFGGMGPMPMGGMGGGGFGGGDAEYNNKVGRGGGFGPGSGGSSTGAGAATPGSGSSSAARPGGVGAAEAAAGRGIGPGSSGAGGRSSGMGGARGRGSEGEEDQEHQRPTYLVEGDPDEVFGTDMRTAPPVIGE